MDKNDILKILDSIRSIEQDMKKYDDHPLTKREKEKRHALANRERTEEDEKRLIMLLKERGIL